VDFEGLELREVGQAGTHVGGVFDGMETGQRNRTRWSSSRRGTCVSGNDVLQGAVAVAVAVAAMLAQSNESPQDKLWYTGSNECWSNFPGVKPWIFLDCRLASSQQPLSTVFHA